MEKIKSYAPILGMIVLIVLVLFLIFSNGAIQRREENKRIQEEIEDAYQSGMDYGKEKGYQVGYADGEAEGYQAGQEEGSSTVYSSGY